MQHASHFPFSIKAVSEQGSFAGYASIFNTTDSQSDMILHGAFRRTLKEKNGGKDIKLLWQHQPSEPIGIFTSVKEDEIGLYVEGQLLLDLQRGREAYALIKSGAVNGLSIGYNAVSHTIDSKTGTRIVSDIDLWEISLVTFPANQLAGITAVKQEVPSTVREFEQFLREAGYSRNHAKAIALGGFESKKQRDAAEEEAALLRTIDAAIETLIHL